MNIRFEIGDRVELTQMKSAVGYKVSNRKYRSQLLDFDGIRVAKISMPIYENKLIPLEIGDDYKLCFFTEAGLYECKGTVTKRYIENKIHVVDIFFLSDLKKCQRRKFYRLDCMFPIRFRLLSDVELKLLERMKEEPWTNDKEKEQYLQALEKIPKEWEEGTVSDLSGGGMRFHANKELKPKTIVEVMLPLSLQSGIVPLTFKMETIACIHSKGSKVAYEIRGQFHDVKDLEREMVIKYVFDEQRRRMRKE